MQMGVYIVQYDYDDEFIITIIQKPNGFSLA